MAEKIKCSNCKTYYISEMPFAHFRPGGTLCPDCRRNKQLSESLDKASSKSQSSPKTETVYISNEPTAEEILAEAKAEHLDYELSKKKKQDSAQKPWMFDENFSNVNRINAITFPNDIEDVEKTILRITKAGTEKCKSVVETTYSEFQQNAMGDQKAMWNPFHEELAFVEACIEKSNEGLKKLRRFEGNNVNMVVADCQDSIDDLSNKWFPKLIEKREKKKKQTYIIMAVVVVLFAAMMIGLSIASK
jgi:hypothetical protein